MEPIVIFAVALLIVALFALIINVALCPTTQGRDYQRLMDEEKAERETVNAILQAYLDGIEYGIFISKVSQNNPHEIDNNDKKEKNGE